LLILRFLHTCQVEPDRLLAVSREAQIGGRFAIDFIRIVTEGQAETVVHGVDAGLPRICVGAGAHGAERRTDDQKKRDAESAMSSFRVQ
jgi:hypothetical protein